MTRWPKDKVPHDYEFYKGIGVSPWWMNWETWAQSKEELDFAVNKINSMAEDFKKNRAKDGAAMKFKDHASLDWTPWELHPKQIESRMKKPNKIAIPYSFWEAGYAKPVSG